MPAGAEYPPGESLVAAAEADVALADLLEDPVGMVPEVITTEITAATAQHDSRSHSHARRLLTFGSALLSCLCAGSIMLFALYAPQFQTHLGYTQVQVNVLSILGEAGMYLTTPVVGISADVFGSGVLSLIAAFFYASAYSLAAWSYAASLPFPCMMLSFLFIGCGTACMYFGSITVCAKTFASNRGLALGLPITAYGLSSLWLSQVVAWFFTDRESGEVAVSRLFGFFAVFLAVVALLAAAGFQLGYRPELEAQSALRPKKAVHTKRVSTDESAQLLNGDEPVIEAFVEDGEEEVEEITSPLTRTRMVLDFVSDYTAWVFALGLFTTTGPGEMFLNNMGSIIRSIGTPGPSAPTNVAVIAFSSVTMRIAAGVASDQLAARHRSRMGLLLFFAAFLGLGHFMVGFGGAQIAHGRWFWVVSAILGAGYGAVFTLAPAVVSLVWGAERFGTNWGVLFVFPAIGAIVYELLYAAIYDAHSADARLCLGLECYRATFLVTGMSCIVAFLAWLCVWRISWNLRGVFV
ncbi:major facilitator superfamily domain-containing protein [Limtongia smithiae]|uniref:major facilitator superfamily domain-containing protein n=1 Tax=Limtongia smithiae TaxID=1125753 RepID=UPI0034CD324D